MPKAAPESHSSAPEPRSHDPGDVLYDRMVRLGYAAQEQWRQLAAIAGALVLLGCIIVGVRQYRASTALNAATAYFEATQQPDAAAQLEALTAVAAEYGSSGGGLQAAFAGAQLAIEREEYARAESLYADFVAAQPESPLAPAAQVARAAMLEAAGKTSQAEAAYQEAIERYPLAYVRPQAQLALGRLAEARGDTAAALNHYRDILSMSTGTPWESQASTRLAALAPETVTPDVPLPTSETP